MKIKINLESIFKNTIKDIVAITDKAKVCIDKVRYIEKNKSIIIPIRRKKIIAFKKKLFSSNKKPIYNSNTLIDSVITINNIDKYAIKNKCKGKLTEITILFGIQINGKEIYLSSAEEDKGVTLYEIIMKANEIDIELNDTDPIGG